MKYLTNIDEQPYRIVKTLIVIGTESSKIEKKNVKIIMVADPPGIQQLFCFDNHFEEVCTRNPKNGTFGRFTFNKVKSQISNLTSG